MSETATSLRSHTCGAIGPDAAGSQVAIAGWVAAVEPGRALWLRDGHGRARVALAPRVEPAVRAALEGLAVGDVARVEGVVVRLDEAEGADGAGALAVAPTAAARLAPGAPPPLEPGAGDPTAPERRRHRHLELRAPALQEALRGRFRLEMAARELLAAGGYLEVDAPLLGYPDAEAARRGFLVPARPGRAFALPWSVTPYGRLLAAGGIERAFQLTRVFRRAEAYGPLRQPEASVLEVVLAFVGERALAREAERLLGALWERAGGAALADPLPRLSWSEALHRFGSGCPDLRFELELRAVPAARITGLLASPVFAPGAVADDAVFAVPVPAADAAALPDEGLAEEARAAASLLDDDGAATWLRVDESGGAAGPGGRARAIDHRVGRRLVEALGLEAGAALVLVGAGARERACRAAGAARRGLSRRAGRMRPAPAALLVTELPFTERDPDGEGSITQPIATQPIAADEGLAHAGGGPGGVRMRALRLVIDGVEVGTARVLHHDVAAFRACCALLGYRGDAVDAAFGGDLAGLRFGVPPHGVIRFGVERLAALLLGRARIDDVTAFPKDAGGADGLLGGPSPIAPIAQETPVPA